MITRKYKPLLDALDLTYTQYIAMMVFWEDRRLSVKELGQKLFLDSGTLTPLLKSMEQKGLILRRRSASDERSVTVSLTEAGWVLRERALAVPGQVGACVKLEAAEAAQLYTLLYKLLGSLNEEA
jgi:DNA-binding MarR family transcriptional regulator